MPPPCRWTSPNDAPSWKLPLAAAPSPPPPPPPLPSPPSLSATAPHHPLVPRYKHKAQGTGAQGTRCLYLFLLRPPLSRLPLPLLQPPHRLQGGPARHHLPLALADPRALHTMSACHVSVPRQRATSSCHVSVPRQPRRPRWGGGDRWGRGGGGRGTCLAIRDILQRITRSLSSAAFEPKTQNPKPQNPKTRKPKIPKPKNPKNPKPKKPQNPQPSSTFQNTNSVIPSNPTDAVHSKPQSEQTSDWGLPSPPPPPATTWQP